MPIKLDLEEKCYIVAMLGDVPPAARDRLYSMGRFPTKAGKAMPALLGAGYRYLNRFQDEKSPGAS